MSDAGSLISGSKTDVPVLSRGGGRASESLGMHMSLTRLVI